MNATPVIIRENENGKVIGLIPTLPDFYDHQKCVLLNSRGEFNRSKAETVKDFMQRTTTVSAHQQREFLALISRNYEGRYVAVNAVTKAMNVQRKSNFLNNPEFTL